MLEHRIIVISDSSQLPGSTDAERAGALVTRFQELVDAGAGVFQLRERQWSDSLRLSVARTLVAKSREGAVKVLINDRPDLARIAHAAGVHLPEQGWPIAEARPLIKRATLPHMTLGRSTHSIEAALTAEREGADYVIFGPIFATASKASFGAPLGLDALRELSTRIHIRVFAVGGVSSAEHVRQCREAGAYGVAAIGAFMSDSDAVTRFTEFRTAVDAE